DASRMHILQGLTKMRQICNTPALLADNEYYGSQSAKLDELITQVLKLQSEHKVLIFSQFVGMLDLIKVRLDQETIKYAYLTGQTRKRQEQVEAFQEDEEIRVFLISLKAGGTGLNLTEAEYVFIVDPWWNPAVENQAIDRAYRIGQTNKVIAIRMITPNTIEEKIMELQDRKKKLVEELIHTDSGFFKQLTKNDLMGMV
ncbi:MAG TPA: C-terminal helicase domain-containing protein, partial [Salinimicrobium sp.]|nr:C-terminal helicase domain-containing protein [Salinimicrobium sp.]